MLEKSEPKLSLNSLSLDSIVAAKETAISTDLDGEIIILNTAQGVYFGLDAVGALIWSRIQKPTLLREVRDAVLNEYEVDAAVCEADLLKLVHELDAAALVNVAGLPSLS